LDLLDRPLGRGLGHHLLESGSDIRLWRSRRDRQRSKLDHDRGAGSAGSIVSRQLTTLAAMTPCASTMTAPLSSQRRRSAISSGLNAIMVVTHDLYGLGQPYRPDDDVPHGLRSRGRVAVGPTLFWGGTNKGMGSHASTAGPRRTAGLPPHVRVLFPRPPRASW